MTEKHLNENERNTQELKVILEPLYRCQLADSEAYGASVNLVGFLQVLSEIEKDVKTRRESEL